VALKALFLQWSVNNRRPFGNQILEHIPLSTSYWVALWKQKLLVSMHGGLTVAKQCASLTLGHDSMVPAFFFTIMETVCRLADGSGGLQWWAGCWLAQCIKRALLLLIVCLGTGQSAAAPGLFIIFCEGLNYEKREGQIQLSFVPLAGGIRFCVEGVLDLMAGLSFLTFLKLLLSLKDIK